MNQNDQMREALRSFIEAMDLCGGYPDTSTDRERFDEAKRKAEQALAAEPAPRKSQNFGEACAEVIIAKNGGQ